MTKFVSAKIQIMFQIHPSYIILRIQSVECKCIDLDEAAYVERVRIYAFCKFCHCVMGDAMVYSYNTPFKVY